MRFFVALIVSFLTFAQADSDQIVAQIKQVDGEVLLLINSEKRLLKGGENITQKNSIIKTEKDAKVIIVWSDGSVIVVGENSSLNVVDEININQQSGEAYYKTKLLKPLNNIRSNSFKVTTKTATIGIRGTEFIVSQKESTNIKLKEGKLEILAIEKEFEIYKEKLQKEFEDFKKGFEDYKQKTMSQFGEYKEKNWQFSHKAKSVDLMRNRTIKIDGNSLYEEDITDEDLEDFAGYRDTIKEIK